MKLTRRTLLSSVAAAVLVRPAMGQVSPSGEANASFWGNPNVIITAIDTSGGIEVPVIGGVARDGGGVPFFLHASASLIACKGDVVDTAGKVLQKHAVRPYEDLEYRWDFGDPQGAEVFTSPTTGKKVNANADQYGPEAAYCYRKPGTYTVTLSIRACAGRDAAAKPNKFITATVRRQIVVRPFAASGTWYFDSHAPAGGHGRSPGSPLNDLKTLNAKANISGSAIFIKRGSVWTYSGGEAYSAIRIANNVTSLRIGAYGTGRKPTIISNYHSCVSFSFSKSYADIVISDLALQANPQAKEGPIVMALGKNNTAKYLYTDNCDFICNVDGHRTAAWSFYPGTAADSREVAGNQGVNAFPCGGTWNCTISTSLDRIFGGLWMGAVQWMFNVGLVALCNTVEQHINTEDTLQHYVLKWSHIAGSTKNIMYGATQSLRARAWTGAINKYQIVSDCLLTGGATAIDVSDHADYDSGVLNHMVVERSRFGDFSFNVLLGQSLQTFTWRDNEVWSNCQQIAVGRNNQGGTHIYDLASGNLYRNKHYRAAGNTSQMINLLANSELLPTKPQPWQITDNVLQDDRAGENAKVTAFYSKVQQAAGTLMDRNRYWAPNATGAPKANYFQESGGKKSLAQVQALGFEPNGRGDIAPRWVDPANGKFDA